MIRPRFGVEIEFNRAHVGEADIARALTEAGLDTQFENYNHHTRAHWKLTTDSSCGLELVTPPLFWEDRHSLREACRVLQSLGATVNGDCGLHVHHEWPWMGGVRWRNRQERLARVRRVVVVYESLLPLLRCILPKTRFSIDHEGVGAERYCRWNSGLVISGDGNNEGIEGVRYEGRAKYVAVNTENLSSRTTIEFRQHQGTLNPTKIIGWVELTRQVVHAASILDDQIPEGVTRASLIFDKMSTSTIRYLSQRCEEHETTLDEKIEEITATLNEVMAGPA